MTYPYVLIIIKLFHAAEADPENYENLKVNRERAVNVHGALCGESRLLHYSSLGVVPVRGFVEFMTPSFMKKWHGKIYNNRTRVEDLPTVQCMPPKLLLLQLGLLQPLSQLPQLLRPLGIQLLSIGGGSDTALLLLWH